MSDRARTRVGLMLAVAALIACVGVAAFFVVRRPGNGPPAAEDSLPEPGSETYRAMVSAFYAGVAALDVEANEQARTSLTRASELVPAEPSAWANLGVVEVRKPDYEAAARDLERARGLAPDSAAIERMLGLLAGLTAKDGQYAEAIAHLRRAVELDPRDLKARFALIKEVERQAEPGGDAEALRMAGALMELQPDNLDVLLERARLAVKLGDAQALGDTVARLGRLAPSWPEQARAIYRDLERAARANPRSAVTLILRLRNVLVRSPDFRRGQAAVETPVGTIGTPIETFLRLADPPPSPSPPDDAIAFAVEPMAEASASRWDTILAVPMTAAGPPTLFAANGREVRRVDGTGAVLPFPGGPQAVAPSPSGVLAVDWNSDYRMDLVLAGAGGLKVFEQKEDGTFADVTAATKLDPGILGAGAFGVWAADIEMDGDLDLVLGAGQGRASVLRNNGDGTFTEVPVFEGATDLRDFAWADLDADGDPDAALLDARGGLLIYSNERAGRFTTRPVPEELGTLAALAVTDLNGDGIMDLLAMRPDGTVLGILDREDGHAWEVGEVVDSPGSVGNAPRLLVADMDNNGAADLIGWGSSGGWMAIAGQGASFRTDHRAGRARCLRRRRPERRRPTRPGGSFGRRSARPRPRSRDQGLPLAGHPASGRQDLR